jgi:hypothetical protein
MSEPAGWFCPRCQKVNAPWREACDCAPAAKTITITPDPRPYTVPPPPYRMPSAWVDWRPWPQPWQPWPQYTYTLCNENTSAISTKEPALLC